jgi:KDO2-lipid IV(A) lauroyltransferase
MYYLVYGFFYLLSLLPLWMLYGLSNFTCWLLFRVFGYRKWVVKMNLALAFPNKTEAEREAITRAFQLNFTDTFIETIKLFSANKKWLMEHFKGDFHVMNELYDKGLKCQVHMGHNFNWEMGNLAYNYYCKHPMLGVYMPLQNKTMDRIFKKLRSRTGTILLPATDMRRSILPFRDKQYLIGLVADQVPANPNRSWWLNFFKMPTAFIPGPEKGARAGNVPVVFVHITKEKRGHYYLHATLAAENPAQLPEGELTRQYRDFLEEAMKQNPEMWLWSHRRWKKPWDKSYQSHWIDVLSPPAKSINPYVANTN